MKPIWTKPSLSQDFLLISGVIVFILFLVSIWVTYESYLAHSEKVFKQLESEATRIDRTIIITIENGSYVLESIGRQMVHSGVDNLYEVARLLQSLDGNTAKQNVFSWVDASQQIVASSKAGVLDKPVDVSDRDYMKKSITEPWKIQIGRPTEGRHTEKWVLPVALGLTDYNGKYLGSVLLSIDIHSLTEEIRGVIKKSGISFAILSRNLILMTEQSDAQEFLQRHFSLDQLSRINFDAISFGELSRPTLFEQGKIYSVYEVSNTYPFIYLLGYDAAQGWEGLRQTLLPRLLQLLVIAAFLMSFLWMIRQRVIRPVVELAAVTEGIARGETFTAITTSGPVEIESLATQIHKISDFIWERKQQLDEMHMRMATLRSGKETAERSQKVTMDFLTAMNHQIRTPLNTIVGFSEVMKNQLYGPFQNEHYLDYASDIHSSSHHLMSLINDLTALSKIKGGLESVVERPVDVIALLQKEQQQMLALQQKGQHLEIKKSDPCPHLRIDEQRLRQIFDLLLNLASARSSERETVTVFCRVERERKKDTAFAISISDAGNRQQWQSDPNHQPGLPLARALAAVHEGSMEIAGGIGGKPMIITLRFPSSRIVYEDVAFVGATSKVVEVGVNMEKKVEEV